MENGARESWRPSGAATLTGSNFARRDGQKARTAARELAEQLLATPGELSSLVNSYAAGDSLGNSIAGYNPDVVNANAQVASAGRQVEQLKRSSCNSTVRFCISRYSRFAAVMAA